MKYRFVNSNVEVEMTKEVAESINRTNQVFISSGKEFKSLLEMQIYGAFEGVSLEEVKAYVKICEELAKIENVTISDPDKIFYDMFVPA